MRRIYPVSFPFIWAMLVCVLFPLPLVLAQSADPAHPSPVMGREIKGNIFAKDETPYYYSFMAGPGSITLKLTLPHQEGFAMVRLDATDQASRTLLNLEATNNDREKSGSFSLGNAQLITLRVRGARTSNASAYMLRIVGLVSFGSAPVMTQPPRTSDSQRVDSRLPTIKILSPTDGTEVTQSNLRVSYHLSGTAAERAATTVRVFINGEALQSKGQSVRVTGDNVNTGMIDLSLPPADCDIALIAEHTNGTASEPAKIRVKWRGQVQLPKLYVLAVGVNAYKSKDLDKLTYPIKDAQDFVTAWNQQKGGLYQDVEVITLKDATRGEILGGFETLRKKATRYDVAVILLSGHGVNDLSGRYFYMPLDGEPTSPSVNGVSANDIKTLAEDLQGKVVVFLDTCHAGNAMGGTMKGAIAISDMRAELTSAENGAVVFASSTGRQRSLENPEWKNGAFTKALIEGLSGKADVGNDGRITLSSLDYWIAKRVKELTGGQQTPVMLRPGQVTDFPIAVRR
jgi:Caspase domain